MLMRFLKASFDLKKKIKRFRNSEYKFCWLPFIKKGKKIHYTNALAFRLLNVVFSLRMSDGNQKVVQYLELCYMGRC